MCKDLNSVTVIWGAFPTDEYWEQSQVVCDLFHTAFNFRYNQLLEKLSFPHHPG